jgi:hypothetical protein
MEERWNVAIILDACRYDFFKELYRNYLQSGRLERRLGASDTLDWLHTVFSSNKTKNIVYVSAHPGINSKDIPWGRFNACEQFYKVYDAWLSGWDWEIGSALPTEVAKTAIQAMNEHRDRKIIIHFIQPHFPYRKAPCPSTYSDLKSVKKNPFLGFLLEKLLRRSSLFNRNFSRIRTSYWKVKKTLKLNFLEDLNEIYWKKYNVKDLKHFYRDNLNWVLESVRKIIEEYEDEEIVVTSDHGEAFGENGEFFHLYNTMNPVVRWVPFWRNN